MASSGKNKLKSFVGQSAAAIRGIRMTPVEIFSLVATIAFALGVMFFYIFEVRSRRTELDSLDARERAALTRILDASARQKKLEAQRSNASSIIDSIASFEKRLKNRELGTPAIITEVNSLARQHRAVAGDYTYKVIEGEAEAQAKESASSQRVESPNTYTALGIDTTVVGDYADLRRLIAAIERSPQFIVINSLAFQGEADRPGKGVPPPGMQAVMPAVQAKPVTAVPAGVGGAVSLKVEMQTFFRNDPK